MLDLDRLDFTKGGGLVTVVAQDASTGCVLMVAHADREALERTVATGEMHYRSRTRGLWHKGATSGNRQRVVGLEADCDGDAVLASVEPLGPACHTGQPSCFAAPVFVSDALADLDRTIGARARASNAANSYTRRLLDDRNLRLKKIGEEAAELVLACADEDRSRAANETADLWYHSLTALHAVGGSLNDVLVELRRRAQPTR
jgi:phosphoribosyl-ATP pyrophosphohydrolase/phosphoribosyl-AMP cyclohydrolase